MQARLISLLLGYAFGCFITAELVTRRLVGKRPAEIGSGNPGMANIMAQLGFRAGALVLAGDVLKTAAACVLAAVLFPAARGIAPLYAGLGAVLGHDFPFWNRFRGGKGVASTCMALFVYDPLWGLLADIAGMLAVFSTGWLPLGGVLIPLCYFVFALCLRGAEPAALAAVLTLLAAQRHWPGLLRVLRGQEKPVARLFARKKS